MPLEAPRPALEFPTLGVGFIKVGCFSPPPIPVLLPAPIPDDYGID